MLDFAFVRAGFRLRAGGCLRHEGNTAAPSKSVMTVGSSQLVKLHSVPRSKDRIAGYQIGSDQSANIPGCPDAREWDGPAVLLPASDKLARGEARFRPARCI
jgi:hypothetical protein